MLTSLAKMVLFLRPNSLSSEIMLITLMQPKYQLDRSPLLVLTVYLLNTIDYNVVLRVMSVKECNVFFFLVRLQTLQKGQPTGLCNDIHVERICCIRFCMQTLWFPVIYCSLERCDMLLGLNVWMGHVFMCVPNRGFCGELPTDQHKPSQQSD